jgi:hypothetical protein
MMLGTGPPVAATPSGEVVTAALDEPPTAFGAVVKPQGSQTYPNALAQSESRYGRLGVIRYFDANAPDPWAEYTARWGDRPVIVSFRIPPDLVLNGSQDQALRRFFRDAPTGQATYWSYMHEPEDDIARGEMTARAFRRAFAHVAALAAEARNPQLYATLIMMCYTVNPTSGRNWRDYYAAGAVQLIAWDCYNHAWRRGGYGTPENLLSRAVATSQETGLPWGIAELGSVVGSEDSSGSGRAAWLRACGQYLIDRGARFVSYFDTNGKRTDYRLLDEPSRAAWDELVTDQVTL